MTPCTHRRQLGPRGPLPCARLDCPGNEGYGPTFRVPVKQRDLPLGGWDVQPVFGVQAVIFRSDGEQWHPE